MLSQLSYSPKLYGKSRVVRKVSYTFLSILDRAPDVWWVWEDLNFRPHPYQGCALTN